jgi:hypothetical protein
LKIVLIPGMDVSLSMSSISPALLGEQRTNKVSQRKRRSGQRIIIAESQLTLQRRSRTHYTVRKARRIATPKVPSW